jgi:hypothetical protein
MAIKSVPLIELDKWTRYSFCPIANGILRDYSATATQEDEVLAQSSEPRAIFAEGFVPIIGYGLLIYRILTKRILTNSWIGLRDFILFFLKINSTIFIRLTAYLKANNPIFDSVTR